MKNLLTGIGVFALSVLILSAQPSHTVVGIPENADGGVIKGKVIEDEVKKPMEFVNIVLFSASDSVMVAGTVTNLYGEFRMKNIPFGEYYAEVNFIGYEKKRIMDIFITKDQRVIDLGDISLVSAVKHLDGVEIVADKQHVVYQIDKKVVNVSQDLRTAGGTAIEALEKAGEQMEKAGDSIRDATQPGDN